MKAEINEPSVLNNALGNLKVACALPFAWCPLVRFVGAAYRLPPSTAAGSNSTTE